MYTCVYIYIYILFHCMVRKAYGYMVEKPEKYSHGRLGYQDNIKIDLRY